MSAYKRFVSYLYEYDNRKKGKNRGFVRVEVRNHQCCLELHMTLPACPFIPVFRAYAFVARPGTLHGLFLGNPSWKQGNVYGQFRIADTSICNSSWNLDDIDGLNVAGTVSASSLVATTGMSTPEIEVKTGFLGTNVTVTIKHNIPMPGVLAYLGYDGSTTLKAAAYTFSINPSEFVRNVDLAEDLTKAIFDKLGLDYGSFTSKTQSVLQKIL